MKAAFVNHNTHTYSIEDANHNLEFKCCSIGVGAKNIPEQETNRHQMYYHIFLVLDFLGSANRDMTPRRRFNSCSRIVGLGVSIPVEETAALLFPDLLALL